MADTKAPKKPGIFKNIIEVYKMTSEVRPNLKFYLILAFLIPLLIILPIILIFKLWVLILLAIMIPLLAMMIVLSRVADKAGFERIDGQPGASGAILNTVKFANTIFDEQPVYVNPKTYDLIFRGTGRGGIFLVTEGPTNRLRSIVQKELQKIKRVVPNVNITIVNTGNDADQVKLKELKKRIMKVKITLTKAELAQVRNRLNALGVMKLPIPKGMDPNKAPKGGGRRALRGK